MAVRCIERGKLTKISMENLLTEIEVMKELDHKHIVKLKDFEVFIINEVHLLYVVCCRIRC